MKFLWLLFIITIGLLAYRIDLRANEQKKDDALWTTEFAVEKSALSATGRNPYFILEPGYQLVFEGGKERLVITVQDETKLVDGVETRVVEERETKAGKLVEVSRNYFAISRRTNDVFYFGEDVDIYKNEKVAGHSGAWLAGVNGAKFGLMMPGEVWLRARYYQEIAPKVAMDRAEIVSLSETVKTPAGEFKNCLKVEETTPLEPGVKEYKYYAAGVGLVQDGSLKLVKYGKAEKSKN
ncbi:MAG: hypothetical protein ACREBD_28695 [Blastocatellia bacterium]